MARVLRRPMFRLGGNTDQGIMSGVAPRQGYAEPAGMVAILQTQKSIIDALAPREPRKDTSGRDFMVDWGLGMISGTPKGNIFATAAEQAKAPFAKFQQAKQLETAYGQRETSEDRALIADLIKGMDEDELSAMMKRVKAGVSAGYYKDENDGIIRELRVREQGVQDAPGEAREKRIGEIEDTITRADPDEWGVARKVAEHKYKIEAGEYPKALEEDLNQTRFYIKHTHIVGTNKDAEGEIIEIVIDSMHDKTYKSGQIYLDPQTGDLFKRTSKQGEEVIFTKVILE